MLRDDFLKLMNLTLYEPIVPEADDDVQRYRDKQLATLDELIALDLSMGVDNGKQFIAKLSSLLEKTPFPDDKNHLEKVIGEQVSILDLQRAAILQRMELGFQNALAKKDKRLNEAIGNLSDWSFGDETPATTAIFGATPEKYIMMEEPMPGRKTSYFQGLQKMQKGYPAEIEKQMALSSSPSSMVSPSDDNDFSSTSSSVTISSDEPLSPDQALSDTSKADEPSWSSMISIDSYEKTVRLSDIKALLDPTTPASTRLNYLEEAHPLMEDILLEINELPDPQKQHATRKLMSLWDDIQQLAAPFEFVKEQAMRLHDLSAHFSQNHETLLTEVDNIHAAIVKTMAPYKDDPSYSPLVKKYVSWADERLSEMQSLLALAEGAKMLEGFNSQAPLHIDINSTDMLYNNRVYAAMLLLTHGTDISISSGNNIEPAASSDHEREKQAFIQKYLLDSIENIERDWVRTAITEGLSAFAAERGFDGDGMTFYQMQVAKVTSPGADTEEQPPSPSCMR